jgi:hypothetical protein
LTILLIQDIIRDNKYRWKQQAAEDGEKMSKKTITVKVYTDIDDNLSRKYTNVLIDKGKHFYHFTPNGEVIRANLNACHKHEYLMKKFAPLRADTDGGWFVADLSAKSPPIVPERW